MTDMMQQQQHKLHMKVVKKLNPKSFHHKENFFSISLILYVYKLMDVV